MDVLGLIQIVGWRAGITEDSLCSDAEEYARRYPFHRPPDVYVIRRLDDRLRNTEAIRKACVEKVRKNIWPTANLYDAGRPQSSQTVAQVGAVLHRVEYPTVQGLKPDDCQKRVTSCEWLLQQQNTDNGFIAHILWTDEACFTRDGGVFNHHNNHKWSQVNSHAIRLQEVQERWSLNVWAGILGYHLFIPYLLPERLSGQSYLVFLNDISLVAIQGLWFQNERERERDGAPAHFCTSVCDWLDIAYSSRCIGRQGPVLWPPLSPDLIPLDFFLWDHLKELVYRDSVTTLMSLVARLHAACTSVDPAVLRRVISVSTVCSRMPLHAGWKL
ncbi:DUF4817 domain-containing protein [Trichonephila clavipes]|nr:DUF4817 domain-containing protein [Trichonephila clavipes]